MSLAIFHIKNTNVSKEKIKTAVSQGKIVYLKFNSIEDAAALEYVKVQHLSKLEIYLCTAPTSSPLHLNLGRV